MGTNQRRDEGSTALVDRRADAHAPVCVAEHSRAFGTDEAVFWTSGVATDVAATWRRYGWVPPSELPEYHAKWDAYQQPTRIR
jgi:hypothetical protein